MGIKGLSAVKANHLRLVINDGKPTSYVYFIQRGQAGSIKIGYGKNPAKRLRDLQVGSDRELRLIGVTPGGVALERTLHQEFAELRLSGEWFRADASLSRRIRELTGASPDSKLRSPVSVMEEADPPGPLTIARRRAAALASFRDR